MPREWQWRGEITWSYTHRNLKQGLIKKYKTKTEQIHVHVQLNHFAVYLKLTLCKSITLQFKKKAGTETNPCMPMFFAPQSENKRFFLMCYIHIMECVIHSAVSDPYLTSQTVAHQAPLSLEFSRQEYTGVGSHSLLQGIFPTQGTIPSLLHCRLILYHLSHKVSSKYTMEFSINGRKL